MSKTWKAINLFKKKKGKSQNRLFLRETQVEFKKISHIYFDVYRLVARPTFTKIAKAPFFA
jgi:hypothetical protein